MRARRGRPCGASSRVPSAGRGGAGRPRGITLRRRAASLRPAVQGVSLLLARPRDEVQDRGGRPPGEGARDEGGRAGMSAEKRERLRERGARRVLKLKFDSTCRPVGRTAHRLVREAWGTAWGIVRRRRAHAARAAGHVRGGARVGRGEE